MPLWLSYAIAFVVVSFYIFCNVGCIYMANKEEDGKYFYNRWYAAFLAPAYVWPLIGAFYCVPTSFAVLQWVTKKIKS